MTRYKHTVNLAFALNVVVFDDRGRQTDAFIFPFILLAISLPGLAYRLLRSSLFTLISVATAWLSALAPGGWREDLRFMSLAVVSLFSPPSGRGWGRAAL